MTKDELAKLPETIRTVQLPSFKSYTLEELTTMLTTMFKEVEHDFRATHKNITVSIENDWSNCYYDGESPDIALEFSGIKHVGGKKRK